MTNVLTSVFYSDSSAPPLPLPISGLFWMGLKIHALWKWKIHTFRVLEDSQNTMSYFCGYTVQHLGVGEGVSGIPISWVARLVLICDCYIRTRKQYERTCQTYQDLIETISLKKNDFITGKSLIRSPNPLFQKVLGNETEQWIHAHWLKGIKVLQKTALTAIRFIADLFSLSQYCILLVESFSWDEATRVSAIRNFFLNFQTVLTELSENKELLKCRLVELEPVFATYLRMDISPIVKSTNAALDFTANMSQEHDHLMSILSSSAQIAGKATLAVSKRFAAIGWLLVSNDLPEPLRDDISPLPQFGQIEHIWDYEHFTNVYGYKG